MKNGANVTFNLATFSLLTLVISALDNLLFT